MRLIGRLTLIALMVPLPAGAKQLCDVLGASFAENSLVLVASDKEATCQSNGAVTCWWEFPYRSGAARETYANLVQDLSACPTLIAATKDTGVNHPDTYDAVQFDLGVAAWVLSLKDKSALGKSYVFLRQLGPE